ncbi:FAD-binding oxidoreductase [Pseudoroseicyclus tamaricis]|uniref:FAD-binding oxidoreductase n=1 Tax=Pseudoroseicyclus tamaricis TaxID=2705421 RepID=A0A6B2JJZ7_9RHOB|nr:FAD-binding oxidoreductase [Pseudoroseicyclus tamaricis]NDV01763.1 FAD-binding oxidoreductase [Pseudoroseicyclus tamaricis]
MSLQDASDSLIDALRARLGEAAIREGTRYHEEPRGRWRGRGPVVAPGSTEEVAEVVRACAEAKVGIVPYGGGTGLVGGQIAPEGAVPLVLSLERMGAIRTVYPEENVMVVEAGCILAEVQAAAEAEGRLFPLSLASEGSARIGGLLATNAGGINVLRWGNARALCLGIEAVMADGTVIDTLTRLRKDNTGYDIRDLIVGSEGTLAIITAAALKLVPRPAQVGTAALVVPSPEAALTLLALAHRLSGETLTAFELIHRQGPDFLSEVGPEVTRPFAEVPEWMVLAEVGLPEGGAPEEMLTRLFEAAAEEGLVSDGVIASSEGQRQALWTLRESIPEANKRIGAIASHDIALPLSEVAGFIAEAPGRLAEVAEGLRINCFGHLGDGNLHYNLFPPKGQRREAYKEQALALSRIVHDLAHERGGTISAEHGIGRLKVQDLARYGDKGKLAAMAAIKTALDPHGLLNPGAILPGK